MLYYAAVPWDAALNVTRRMSVCPSVCPTLTVDSENGTPYNVSSNCQNHSEVKPSGGRNVKIVLDPFPKNASIHVKPRL